MLIYIIKISGQNFSGVLHYMVQNALSILGHFGEENTRGRGAPSSRSHLYWAVLVSIDQVGVEGTSRIHRQGWVVRGCTRRVETGNSIM